MKILGLTLVIIGLIPFAVAFLKPIHNGKIFFICFAATIIIIFGIGFPLLWM